MNYQLTYFTYINMELLKAIVFSIVLVGILFFMGLAFGKSQAYKSCQSFGEISGRETKCVEYTYFNYACITPDSKGKWIDTSLLRDIE